MHDQKALLEANCTYHIFNRANGGEALFITSANYQYFLDRYKYYIHPFADTFCYCLMPNHFHFLIRVRALGEIELLIRKRQSLSKTLQGFQTLEGFEKQKALSTFLSQQFSHLLNGYTQAFNKQQGRRGSLFMHPYKRVKVKDEKYLNMLIHYIHYNPIKAGLVNYPADWKFSSYASLISKHPTLLTRDDVVTLFGDLPNFKYCHTLPPEITGLMDF